MGLLFPAVQGAMESARRAKAKNDVVQLALAVKAYQTEYGKLPSKRVSSSDIDEASHGWFQNNNDEVMRVLVGENYDGLNPRKIVFMEARPAKGDPPKDGLGEDMKFYDPWGTPYALKMDTSYNNSLEYYGVNQENNFRTSVIAISFGKNKAQQDPGKANDDKGKVDDVVSFQ